MQAAWFKSFGPVTDVLLIGDQDKPVPGEGQTLVITGGTVRVLVKTMRTSGA